MVNRKKEDIMKRKHEDIFLIDIVAIVIGILGVMLGTTSLGTPMGWFALVGSLTIGVLLYLAGQSIMAKREQVEKLEEQLKELQQIKQLLNQTK